MDKSTELLDEKTICSIVSDYFDGYESIKSGYKDLDKCSGGFHKGEVIILAGATSMGKTAMALNLTLNAVKDNKKTFFVSLEMNKASLLNRLVAIESGINASKYRQCGLSEIELKQYNKTLEDISKLPLFISDNPKMTISGIKSKAVQLMERQGGLDFVVIDYLGLISTENLFSNKYLEVTEISRG